MSDQERVIGISRWLAYVPFRAMEEQLKARNIRVVPAKDDRDTGLLEGRYHAVPLSTFELVHSLRPFLGNRQSMTPFRWCVPWVCVEPLNRGSDRVLVRKGMKRGTPIETVEAIYESRIGVRKKGLEILIFEHLFDFWNLPPKRDYVILPSRDAYKEAFLSGYCDVVMAPQPMREQLEVAGVVADDIEKDLPTFGLRAPVVCNREMWTREEFEWLAQLFCDRATALQSLEDEQLMSKYPDSFEGMKEPRKELKDTICWPPYDKAAAYLSGKENDKDSFRAHFKAAANLVARRFGEPLVGQEVCEELLVPLETKQERE